MPSQSLLDDLIIAFYLILLTIRQVIIPLHILIRLEHPRLDNCSNLLEGSISKCHDSRLHFMILDGINPKGSILVDFSPNDIDDMEGGLVIVVFDLDMGVNCRFGFVELAAGAFEPPDGLLLTGRESRALGFGAFHEGYKY